VLGLQQKIASENARRGDARVAGCERKDHVRGGGPEAPPRVSPHGDGVLVIGGKIVDAESACKERGEESRLPKRRVGHSRTRKGGRKESNRPRGEKGR